VPSDQPPAGSGRAAAFVRAYNRGAVALAISAMGAITLVMALQVFCRYVLNASLIWAEELCRYLLIVMTFLLIGPAFERGEMASVQFLMRRLPVRLAQLAMIPIYLSLIAFLAAVGYVGQQFAALNANYSMPAIDFILSSLAGRRVSGTLSMYWLYMLIPAGCLMLSAHIALAAVRSARIAFGGAGRG
jgi:TRAP-type C4-dicarboxylate transport system permease small subunit